MAASHQGFCDDYFLLNPEKATLFDLFSLLFSPQLETRGFIDCPGSQHQSFLLRWPIFVSVVLQILLIWVKKPMAFMGDAIEMWLNLLSANGGLFRLLLNLPTGKLLAACPPQFGWLTSLLPMLFVCNHYFHHHTYLSWCRENRMAQASIREVYIDGREHRHSPWIRRKH